MEQKSKEEVKSFLDKLYMDEEITEPESNYINYHEMNTESAASCGENPTACCGRNFHACECPLDSLLLLSPSSVSGEASPMDLSSIENFLFSDYFPDSDEDQIEIKVQGQFVADRAADERALAEQATAEHCEEMPMNYETMPLIYEAMPLIYEAMPSSSEATPSSSRAIPSSSEGTPSSRKGISLNIEESPSSNIFTGSTQSLEDFAMTKHVMKLVSTENIFTLLFSELCFTNLVAEYIRFILYIWSKPKEEKSQLATLIYPVTLHYYALLLQDERTGVKTAKLFLNGTANILRRYESYEETLISLKKVKNFKELKQHPNFKNFFERKIVIKISRDVFESLHKFLIDSKRYQGETYLLTVLALNIVFEDCDVYDGCREDGTKKRKSRGKGKKNEIDAGEVKESKDEDPNLKDIEISKLIIYPKKYKTYFTIYDLETEEMIVLDHTKLTEFLFPPKKSKQNSLTKDAARSAPAEEGTARKGRVRKVSTSRKSTSKPELDIPPLQKEYSTFLGLKTNVAIEDDIKARELMPPPKTTTILRTVNEGAAKRGTTKRGTTKRGRVRKVSTHRKPTDQPELDALQQQWTMGGELIEPPLQKTRGTRGSRGSRGSRGKQDVPLSSRILPTRRSMRVQEKALLKLQEELEPKPEEKPKPKPKRKSSKKQAEKALPAKRQTSGLYPPLKPKVVEIKPKLNTSLKSVYSVDFNCAMSEVSYAVGDNFIYTLAIARPKETEKKRMQFSTTVILGNFKHKESDLKTTRVPENNKVYIVKYLPRDPFVLLAVCTFKVRMFNTKTCSFLFEYVTDKSLIYDIDIDSTGEYFATANHNLASYIYIFCHSARICMLTGHDDAVTAVKFHPNGIYVATGSEDCSVRLFEVESAQCVRTFVGHLFGVRAIDISYDGSLIATADYSGMVKVWNIKDSFAISKMALRFPEELENDINSLCFHEDTFVLAVTNLKGEVKFFDARNPDRKQIVRCTHRPLKISRNRDYSWSLVLLSKYEEREPDIPNKQ